MKHLLLTGLALLLFVAAAVQQPRTVTLSGSVDAADSGNTEGAVVEVISGTDTLHCVVNLFHGFAVKKVKPGDVQVRVTHLVYKPFETTVRVVEGRNEPLKIMLERDVKQIDAVSVKADVPLFKRSGDTLIYNAAAVKTLEGDDAVRVLEQLPGVLIENGRLEAMGKQVMRTYVDGRLVFGDDPMAALLNLTADDVQKIRIYDEYDAADKRLKRTYAKKHRVLDIQTKSRLISAVTGHLLAGYGADFSRNTGGGRQERYGAGATVNLFSERLRLSGNAYINNVNRTSNRLENLLAVKRANQPYTENSYVGLGYAQMFGEEKGVSPELSANYVYKNDYSRDETVSSYSYFPTSEYAVRSTSDSLRNTQRIESHTGKVDFSWKDCYLNQNFSFSRDRTESMRDQLSVSDDRYSAILSENASRMRNGSYRVRTGWSGCLSDRWNGYVNGSFSLGWGDGSSLRMDSLSSSALKEVYASSPMGRSRSATASARFVYSVRGKWLKAVDMSYQFQYGYNKSRRLRYDVVRDELDLPASTDYTYDYVTHTPQFAMFAGDNGHSFYLSFPLQISTWNRSDAFPTEDVVRRSFVAPLPHLQYQFQRSTKELMVSYETSTELPSTEQLSSRIDDSSPLYVSTGNPSLKQAYSHNLTASYDWFTSKGAMCSISLSGSVRQNSIVDRTRFYADGAVLSAYDGYVVPAGGSFTTYENVGGFYMGSVFVAYNRRVKALWSRLSVSAGDSYSCMPSFVGDRKILIRSNSASFRVKLTSNFSRKFRLSLSSANSYVSSRNDAGNSSRYFREQVIGTLESTFARRFFFDAAYEWTLTAPVGGSVGVRSDRHMLNAVAGCKFHKNMGAVSLLCYDLLNTGSVFSTRMRSDYVYNCWTTAFGRYWMINVSYKFNRRQSSVKSGGVSLDDGRDATRPGPH